MYVRGIGFPRSEIAAGCELRSVGAGDQVPVVLFQKKECFYGRSRICLMDFALTVLLFVIWFGH